MLKVPIFDTKKIGMTSKTARNTFFDGVVTKFSSRRNTFKDCAPKWTRICQSHLRRKFEEQKQNVFS